MSTLNLNPVTKSDCPTSHVVLRKRKVGSSKLVAAEHRNTKAYFYIEPEEEVISTDLQNTVYIHENAAELFGGIKHGSPFRISTGVGLSEIANCEKATLHFNEGDESRIAEHLRSSRFLLHPGITEVANVGGSLMSFDVVSLQPANYTTLVVTDSTDIEFVTSQEARSKQKSGPSHAADNSLEADQPGGASGKRKQQEGEMDVDIEVTPEKPTVSFEEDVAGLTDVKTTARMLLALFDPDTKRNVTRRYGESFAERGASMLLYGPPGCGKTLVSEAIAYEAANNTTIEDEYGDVKFLPVTGGDILSRYPGEAERRVEAVFEEAHNVAQGGFAVLFFDEIETLIPDRSDDDLQRHERSLTNAFLQEMDTDKIEDNLLVIGATNMPFTIDPAASRRFPLQQFIPQPGETVMRQVWKKELSQFEGANQNINIEYDELAEASIGYTPAEIADRVLGMDLQRELIKSVVEDGEDPIIPDTEYLLSRLESHQPKTVRQFVTSVREDADALEGYPEMRDYVEEQVERLGISMRTEPFMEQLQAMSGDSEENNPGN